MLARVVSVTTEDVIGGRRGIHARNYGTGPLNIVANGDVTGIVYAGMTPSLEVLVRPTSP